MAGGAMQTTVRIIPATAADAAAIASFVAAIQEHERTLAPDLKPGAEIAGSYTEWLTRRVAEHDGLILLARAGDAPVGFVAAWVTEDDDMLLEDAARSHAYVSDIYVVEAWRGKGVGARLLGAIEAEMRRRGCRRMRITAKAGNRLALRSYEDAGFRPYEVTLSKEIG